MVKRNLVNKKRGRPKGSKNKRKVLSAHCEGSVSKDIIRQAVISDAFGPTIDSRYALKSRVEKNELDANQNYYFIYDLKRGDIYPEIIARFTVETEAKLCTEYLNGIRKISKKEYEKKRICIL